MSTLQGIEVNNSNKVTMNNITKKFKEVTAVSDINLDIEAGEFVSLLGPSGCGKTTLLSMILGVNDVTEGSIRFNDQRVEYIPMHQRDVGMVFQNYALFPHMTVEKNVEFGLSMRKTDKEQKKQRVEEALKLVQLDQLKSRFPKELSGGQQQRVALARAIVVQPKVLLLDEPLSNLDAKLRQEMRVQLKQMHKELGITTIYVTHDQEEALSLSTKVAVLSDGHLQQVDTPDNIFLHPKNQFVANFIGYSNFVSGSIQEVEGGRFKFLTENNEIIIGYSENSWHTNIEVGKRAILTIKPENIEIKENSEESLSNIIKSTVKIKDYIGSATSYETVNHLNDAWKVTTLGLTQVPVGEELHLYLPPEKVIVLDKE